MTMGRRVRPEPEAEAHSQTDHDDPSQNCKRPPAGPARVPRDRWRGRKDAGVLGGQDRRGTCPRGESHEVVGDGRGHELVLRDARGIPRCGERRGGEEGGNLRAIEALVGPVIEHPAQDQLPGHGQSVGEGHGSAKPPGHDLARGAFVDTPPREAFKEHDPERPDIRPRPHLMVFELLGGHVGGSAQRRSRDGEGGRIEKAGDAEVAELSPAIRVNKMLDGFTSR